MLKIRPYKPEDSKTVLSWCGGERAFYQWTAGVMGDYPVTPKEFAFVEKLTPFTAFDARGIVGFFTLRQPGESAEELRFGFVIVKPEMRGKGYGKEMLRLGIKYAFDHGANRVSLGVFENNLSAYHCYKSAGFEDVVPEKPETYNILGEEWKCKELILDIKRFAL